MVVNSRHDGVEEQNDDETLLTTGLLGPLLRVLLRELLSGFVELLAVFAEFFGQVGPKRMVGFRFLD